MIKSSFFNFFKRFKYCFICLGLILLGFIFALFIFLGGAQLVISLQPNNLIEEVEKYFINLANTITAEEILSLSILGTIYDNLIIIAGESADTVQLWLSILGVLAILTVYGSFKGSVALVNYLTKRSIANKSTKRGFTPFIVKLIIGAAFSIILIALLRLWKRSPLIVLFIYLLIDAYEMVVSTHYIYFSEKKIKDYLSTKQIFGIMGLFLLSQYSLILICGSLWFITPIATILIALPLLAYGETNIQYTVVMYFKKIK